MTDQNAKTERPWALKLLPPFPTVANKLLALLSSEDVSNRQLSEVIRLDPTFTTELLRIANSALFGLSREVTSVQHALTVLGLERVKALALMVAVSSLMKTALKIESLRKFWTHSLATAILTEEVARAIGLQSDNAYTSGLLHNLGSLGMMSAYPMEYARMLEITQQHDFDILQAERDLFDIDHCEAGVWLAREWNFPMEISQVAQGHHADPVKGDRSVLNVVKVCWRLADTLGFHAFPPKRDWEFEELMAFLPNGGGSLNDADELRAKVRSKLAQS